LLLTTTYQQAHGWIFRVQHPAEFSAKLETENMTTEDSRQECVNLIAHQISQSSKWRLVQAKRFPDDDKNIRAAERLTELAAIATELPDDVWEGLKDHYNFSKQKFGEAVSTTNRSVVFRCNMPDFPTYTRNLLLNVRSASTI
jgi:hypothetical protein